MTAALSDPRRRLARPDLATAELEGAVSAARFVVPAEMVVCVPAAPMTAAPDGTGEMVTQLLFGEPFRVAEEDAHWAWGQSALDGYVGYVPRSCLDDPALIGAPGPTHRVCVLSSHVYPEPDFKSRPGAALTYGARVAVADAAGDWAVLASGGCVPAGHLAQLNAPACDWVAEAERLAGVPYLWGGRSSLGLDCSGLVQLALQAAGIAAPRDSDQQAAELGRDLPKGARPARGDLVFWRGHVGIMVTGRRLLHANIHHMAVAEEPLAEARARIAATDTGPVTRIARLDAGSATA